jgi:hypothetical protein
MNIMGMALVFGSFADFYLKYGEWRMEQIENMKGRPGGIKEQE